MDEEFSGGQIDWMDIFEATADLGWPQPFVSVPSELYRADRDGIVRAARKHGFSRMLATGDQSNVMFCRYI